MCVYECECIRLRLMSNCTDAAVVSRRLVYGCDPETLQSGLVFVDRIEIKEKIEDDLDDNRCAVGSMADRLRR